MQEDSTRNRAQCDIFFLNISHFSNSQSLFRSLFLKKIKSHISIVFSDVFGLYFTNYHIKTNLIVQKLSYLSDHKNNSVISLHLCFEICGGFGTLESFALHVRAFNEAAGEPTNTRSHGGPRRRQTEGRKETEPTRLRAAGHTLLYAAFGLYNPSCSWTHSSVTQEYRKPTELGHSDCRSTSELLSLLRKLLFLASDWLI